MTPTLRAGDIVLAEPYGRAQLPRVGEVVSGRAPGSGLAVLKRIVAGPGDEVVRQAPGCWVNSKWVGPGPQPHSMTDAAPESCGWAQYYLMGDNTLHSTDSRSYGPVERAFIEGRVWLVVWPLKRLQRVARAPWFDRDLFLS